MMYIHCIYKLNFLEFILVCVCWLSNISCSVVMYNVFEHAVYPLPPHVHTIYVSSQPTLHILEAKKNLPPSLSPSLHHSLNYSLTPSSLPSCPPPPPLLPLSSPLHMCWSICKQILLLSQIIFWGCGLLKIVFVAMVIMTLILNQRGYFQRLSFEVQGLFNPSLTDNNWLLDLHNILNILTHCSFE